MIKVNPPPQLKLPQQFMQNKELRTYFKDLDRLLLQLWRRTGGGNDEVAGSKNIEFYPFFQKTNDDEIDLSKLAIFQKTIDVKEAIPITSDFTTTHSHFLICNNTTSITITLNAQPDDLEGLRIIRANSGEVTVNGNGKNIIGQATQSIPLRYDGAHIFYSADVDEWLGI